MKADINQKISQFLDDELHHSEQEALLLNINKDPELTDKFNRYETISYALRTDEFILTNESFLSGVKQGLKDEPHYLLPKKKEKKIAILRPKTAVALAASVGFVAVLVSQNSGFQPNNIQTKESVFVVSEQQVIVDGQAEEVALQLAEKEKVENELADRQHERLKTYLQAHSNDLYTHGSVNIHPYARVATFDRD